MCSFNFQTHIYESTQLLLLEKCCCFKLNFGYIFVLFWVKIWKVHFVRYFCLVWISYICTTNKPPPPRAFESKKFLPKFFNCYLFVTSVAKIWETASSRKLYIVQTAETKTSSTSKGIPFWIGEATIIRTSILQLKQQINCIINGVFSSVIYRCVTSPFIQIVNLYMFNGKYSKLIQCNLVDKLMVVGLLDSMMNFMKFWWA